MQESGSNQEIELRDCEGKKSIALDQLAGNTINVDDTSVKSISDTSEEDDSGVEML